MACGVKGSIAAGASLLLVDGAVLVSWVGDLTLALLREMRRAAGPPACV